jgi:glycosyltransferase involved in cell wall biosynthesis/SAM-dependent methyltransferase
MHMTFAELARVSDDGFLPFSWPGDFAALGPAEAANRLVYAADRIAAERVGGLVGQSVVVASPRADDFVLARLLCCHGAVVHFRSSSSPTWNPEIHSALFRQLIRDLGRTHRHLDLSPLCGIGATNFTKTSNFSVGPWPTAGDPLTGRCDLVCARLEIGTGVVDAKTLVTEIAALAAPGRLVELFGELTTDSAETALEKLVENADLMGLGAFRGCRGAAALAPWRLSLCRLQESIHEFPREQDDSPVLMAHCQARLEFAARYVRGADVLEAGCGMGIGARLFRTAGARRVVGLDYNADALARGRQRTTDEAVVLRQWDLNETPLPLPDNAFDVVVCLEVLEHIHNHERLVAEFLRVLRPDGCLIISVPNKAYEDEWVRYNGYRNMYHVRVPDRLEFERLLSPFVNVRFARQADFIGSVVVEDGPTDSAGRFCFQSAQTDTSAHETLIAVCSKSTTGARPATGTTSQLRLFDNFLGANLGARRQYANLDVQNRELTWHRWAEANRHAATLRSLDALWKADGSGDVEAPAPRAYEMVPATDADMAAEWFRSHREAFLDRPVRAGYWLQRIADLFAEAVHRPPLDGDRPGPWRLSPRGVSFELIECGQRPRARSVVHPWPEHDVGLRTLVRWLRCGVSEAWFLEAEGWKQCDVRGLLVLRLARRVAAVPPLRKLRALSTDSAEARARVMMAARPFGNCHLPPEILYEDLRTPATQAWSAWLQTGSEATRPQASAGPRQHKVVQYIGALYAGGAERQLCNLAGGLARRGVDVRVLTSNDLNDDRGHYTSLLREANVSVRQAGQHRLTPRAAVEYPWHLFRSVPDDLRTAVLNLVAELAADPPDVLHCWLDQPNVIGAMAGILAGVPRIVLSTRNSNPTNFPRLDAPYFRPWYRTVVESRRVHLIANSHSGAASYADWLGIPAERFHVVFNGVLLNKLRTPSPEARRSARESFGLDAAHRVVGGAFRLAAEKQPELFLDVVRQVHARVPNLRVLLAGSGDQADRVAEIVRSNNMAGYVQLLGRRSDPDNVLLASDVSLLTSTLEGCPNIALESQYLGVPLVATAGGGTVDAVAHGETGFLAGTDDSAALADHVTRLLTDDALRARMSAAGPGFITGRFDLNKMVDETIAAYGPAFQSYLLTATKADARREAA